MRLSVRAARRLRFDAAGDEGISLIEVIVSLMIIAVVMASAAGFFLKSLKATGGASSRQNAVVVTNQELESIRAVPPGALLTGRQLSAVQTLLAWPGAAALTANDYLTTRTSANPSLDATDPLNFDPTATASSIPAVPTTTTQTVDNQLFTLHNFVDPCWIAVGTAVNANTSALSCGAVRSTDPSNPSTELLRVTVATSWTGGAATDCTAGCTFSASSLVDPHKDPTFQSNISHPTVTGVSPSLGAGSTGTLVVSGAGFKYGVIATTCGNATVGAIDQSTTTDNAVHIPITAGSGSGSCSLKLTNPDGGNVTTTFTINPAPSVTSVTPSVRNYTQAPVTVGGANFGASAVVTTGSGTWTNTAVNGAGTTVTGMYVANAGAAGNVPVTVTNTDGGVGSGNISVTQSVPSVAVSSGAVGAGTVTNVTLSGSDLASSGETVAVSSGSAANAAGSASGVTFTYTAPATPQNVTVTVTNPDGGKATTTLTVQSSAPVITSVSTSCSPGKSNGDCKSNKSNYTVTFTVSGLNFGSSVFVTFNYNRQGNQTGTLQVSGGSVSFSETYANDPAGNSFTVTVQANSQTSNVYTGTVS